MPPRPNPDKKEKIDNLVWLRDITMKVDNPKQEAKEKFNAELIKNIDEEHQKMRPCPYCGGFDVEGVSQSLIPKEELFYDLLTYRCRKCKRNYSKYFLVKHFSNIEGTLQVYYK